MNYSICLLDKSGRTQHSEFSAFNDDAGAMQYARSQAAAAAIIELWKGNGLLLRLERDVEKSALQ
jgi:hypothetical protein